MTGKRRLRSTSVLLTALVVSLVAAAAYIWRDQTDRLNGLESAQLADAAAVEAATAQALAWTTVDYRKVDDYFASIKKRAAGDFLEELGETEDSLKELTVQNQSVQTAKIPPSGAALVERSQDTATVLVAVDTSVTTVAVPEPKERQYRLKISLKRTSDQWLTTGLEFVG